jgi:hypothetical protein
MIKYKDLLKLLVIVGIVQFVLSGVLVPAVTNWTMGQSFKNEGMLHDFTWFVVLLKYVDVLVWIPVSMWIYRDSSNSNFNPWLWAILTLIAHYQALLIYLLVQLLSEKESIRCQPLT